MNFKIRRQEVAFIMDLPETGQVTATFIAVMQTASGASHRFPVMGVIPEALAGPVRVTVEATLTVAEPPPAQPTLRDELERVLRGEDVVTSQVAAVLELLSERDDLLGELDELTAE